MGSVGIFSRDAIQDFVPLLQPSSKGNATHQNGTGTVNGYSYAIIACYLLLLVAGTIGNTWAISVIVSLLKHGKREPPRNVQLYILFLCIVDAVVLIFMFFAVDDFLHGEWTLTSSSIVCKIYLCSELVNKFFGPFILVALSATCYMCVCKRHCMNVPDDLRVGLIVIIVGAVVTLVLAAPAYVYGDLMYVIVFDDRNDSGTVSAADSTIITPIKLIAVKCMLTSSDLSNLSNFVWFIFVVGYVVPAVSFTFFYVLVLRYVRKHSWRARSLVDSCRVARTVFCLVAFFLCCWTPYWTVTLYAGWNPQEYATSDVNHYRTAAAAMIHLLPYVSCLGYPLIYIFLNEKIKENYEMIRAKRHSQILALCKRGSSVRKMSAFANRRNRSLKSADQKNIETSISPPMFPLQTPFEEGLLNGNNNNCVSRENSDQITEEIQEIRAGDIQEMTVRSEDIDRKLHRGSSVDAQMLFANVNELMELSRHLLIPIVQVVERPRQTNKKFARASSN